LLTLSHSSSKWRSRQRHDPSHVRCCGASQSDRFFEAAVRGLVTPPILPVFLAT
jgi:hypothetical protein